MYHPRIVTAEVTRIANHLEQHLALSSQKSLTDTFRDVEQFLQKEECTGYAAVKKGRRSVEMKKNSTLIQVRMTDVQSKLQHELGLKSM